MIAMLRGKVFHKDLEGAIIDAGGVGYRVEMPVSALSALPRDGEEATIFVHTSVREDAIDLFGFTSQSDKRVFTKLISVTGIGPRLALSCLSAMPAEELVAAVVQGNLALLKGIKGVGKKTAERMILELRDVFQGLDVGGGPIKASAGAGPTPAQGAISTAIMLSDLRSGLTNLGFAPADIEAAVRILREKATDLSAEELFREALTVLRKGVS